MTTKTPFSFVDGAKVKSLLALLAICWLLNLFHSKCALAQDDLARIAGDWVSISSGPRLGEPVTFKKAFSGYDALIPWWGQTSILESGGDHNSHVKIIGSNGGKDVGCYYYITMLTDSDMVWNLRYGDANDCPGSMEFKRKENSDESSDEMLGKGYEALKQKDYDRAIAVFRIILQSKPKSSKALNGVGKAYFEKNAYKQAIENFSNAISIDGKIATYLQNRCWAYYFDTAYEEAIADGSAAVALDPNDAQAFNCRGSAYEADKQYDNALTNYTKAHELDTNNASYKDDLDNLKSKMHSFSIKFCNTTENKLWVALVAVPKIDAEYSISGWFAIDSNSCRTFGKYMNSGGIYWTGDNFRGIRWSGSKKFCVGTADGVTQSFKKELAPETCDPARLRGFTYEEPNDNDNLLSKKLTF